MGRTLKLVPVLVTASFALMTVAWLMGTPLGSAPDEPAHYIKAIGVGRGELYGREPVVTEEELRNLFRRAGDDAAALSELGQAFESSVGQWQERTRRQFRVPAELLNPSFGCTFGDNSITGGCISAARPTDTGGVAESYMGTYQPYLYAPAGVAIRAADDPELGLRLGRAATSAVALALLSAAVWLLWTPAAPALSLLGLVVAVTPMVLFVASTLSPSGPEIASGVCFGAALVRLVRDDPPPRWLWLALAVSGAILAASRSLGPIFLLLQLLSIGALAGPSLLIRRLRGGRAAAVAAGIGVLGGMTAGVAWEAAFQPHPAVSPGSLIDAFRPSVGYLPEVGQQAIGVFGSLDARMPTAGYLLWLALVGVLAAAALAVGGRPSRIEIVALLGGMVVVTVILSLPVREYSPLQGRYILPLLVLAPLWLGDVVLHRRERLPEAVVTGLVVGTFATAGAVQLLAWWTSARRFAVGSDPSWLFLGSADWSPPLGWWTWVLVAALAAAASVAAGTLPLLWRRQQGSGGAP